MITKYEHIKELLDKFYNAETTPEQERELKDFFSSASDLPMELEADRKVFALLSQAESFGEAPADLDSKIMAAIDASDTQNNATVSRSKSKLRRIFIGISAAAAVVALVLTLPFGNEKPVTDNHVHQQLASEKIMDSLKNLELIPEIPPVNELAVINTAQAKGDETVLTAASSPKQSKISSKKHNKAKKSQPEDEETYTLSEEDMKALEMAYLALDNAAQMLSYASGCIEESNNGIAESSQLLSRFLK